MSSQENMTFPAVGLNVPEGRDALWDKTRAAFQYIYDHNLTHSYDWFLKADDDTYVIVENLKYFLRDKNASDLVYYGHHFKPYVRNGYMSGGAGYVISKTAVEKFVELGLTNEHLCAVKGQAEDVSMGRCLQNVGVMAADSRDSLNRSRFLPFSLEYVMKPSRFPDWYYEFAKHNIEKVSVKPSGHFWITTLIKSPFPYYSTTSGQGVI